MKKFFKAITGAVLVCTVATLTGCGMTYDPDRPKIALESLSGLKITYNDGTYALDDTFELYSKHILTEIYANFAIPATVENKSDLTTQPTNIPENYDKIRVQVNNEQEVIGNVNWKWTFSQNCAGCPIETTYENIVSHYSNTSVQQNYFDEWTSLYTIPLEVVAIQIAMGQTPQVFSIKISNQTTTIFTDSTQSKQVDADYLAEIKEQFKTSGTYIGFTEENVATFKNYFLTEIVGNNIIGTQYDKIVMTDGNKTYAQVIDQILALDVDKLEKDFYKPYPASFVEDVTDNSYFAGKEPNILTHVTAKEYQTVTLMTSKDTYILGFYFALEATYDIDIDVKVAFYNNNTQQTTSFGTKTVNVKAGTFDTKNWQMFDLQKQLNFCEFNNSIIGVTEKTQISNTNQNSKYYTYSPNGSYLEGSLIECDCFTISFCPDKTQGEYCPFKWVIDLEMGA